MVSLLRTVVLVLLPLLSLAAFYCLLYLGHENGLFDMINSVLSDKDPLYPGTKNKLVTRYTGYPLVDRQLVSMVIFFAPTVTGTNIPLGLFVLFGFGQFGAIWALLFMESLRKGNQGRAVSFIGTFGLLLQNLSLAVTAPLFLFLYLLTSPIAQPFTSTYSSNALLISPYDTTIVPISVILSFIIPSLLIRSASISSNTHQAFLVFWQAFPLWTVVIYWPLRKLCGFNFEQPTPNSHKASTAALATTYQGLSRYFYSFVLSLCILTHIPTVLLSVFPPEAFAAYSQSLAALATASFPSVFIPPTPVPGVPYHDLAAGVHVFLQWDLYISAIACLLWSVVLYRNAAAASLRDGSTWGSLVLRIAFWTAIAGPFGAVTILLWERDAVLKKIKQ